MTTTTATIAWRTRSQVMVRVPELHPHRILTLPGVMIPTGEPGDQLEVEVRSPIEASPTGGWFALLIPTGGPA